MYASVGFYHSSSLLGLKASLDPFMSNQKMQSTLMSLLVTNHCAGCFCSVLCRTAERVTDYADTSFEVPISGNRVRRDGYGKAMGDGPDLDPLGFYVDFQFGLVMRFWGIGKIIPQLNARRDAPHIWVDNRRNMTSTMSIL